jgi:hypothetical protein
LVSPRRAFVETTLVALAGLMAAPRASATEYKSSADALNDLERLSSDVVGRLRALRELPVARAFCDRLLAEHERLQRERWALRARLGLPAPAPSAPRALLAPRSLAALRDAQNALMLAHAEALPALPDPTAVDRMARHAMTASRHLTLLDLWIEAEDARG